MNVSESIKSIREKKQITQSEMSDRLQMERSNYARLEARGEKLTIENLKRIADALGVDILELMGIENVSVGESPREVGSEKRVAELESIVKDKVLIIDGLERRLSFMIRDIKDDIEHGLVMCALNNAIIEKESYEKYIFADFSKDGKVKNWVWRSLRLLIRTPYKEDLSLFMSKEQISDAIEKLDDYKFFSIEDGVNEGWLPESITSAYNYYIDKMDEGLDKD